jgi:hypothetical protein
MYWGVNSDGTFEMMDGQQRSISICEYVAGSFSINFQYFHNLEKEEQEQILQYKLMIYQCQGSDREKLDWFETINIAGEKLTKQELRNAVFTGPWLSDAKRYFSKPNCAAYNLGSDYIKGSPIRQELLETAISWCSGGLIDDYMSKNQKKPNANELWLHYNSVISWVKTIFPEYRSEMQRVDWGVLYNEYGHTAQDTVELENRVASLMEDDEVSNKAGIYPYVLTGKEKFLNLRAFTDKQKREAYERQGGICPITKERWEYALMEGDHIIPWSRGGKTTPENLQMIYRLANREKSDH